MTPAIKRGAGDADISSPQRSPKATRVSAPENSLTGATLAEASDDSAAKVIDPLLPSTFSKKALPLHVNITHTPPKIADDDESTAPDDPGHIGTMTLVPYTHQTGDCGWEGKKKVIVELLDVGRGEERIQVEAVLSINATVVGSKGTITQGGANSSEADGGVEGYESDNDEPA